MKKKNLFDSFGQLGNIYNECVRKDALLSGQMTFQSVSKTLINLSRDAPSRLKSQVRFIVIIGNK